MVNILNKVRRLEADIARAVERAAEQWSRSGARQPLEIAQAIGRPADSSDSMAAADHEGNSPPTDNTCCPEDDDSHAYSSVLMPQQCGRETKH